MERILLLMAATGAAEAEAALQSALDNALAPKRLSFGLSLLREPDEIEAAALRRLGACQFMAPAADPWQDFAELWQGEGFLLIGSPDMRFVRHWDMLLLRELRACQPGEEAPGSVLTGYLPRPEDPVEAVCPIGVEGFDAEGRLCFHRGTPLRYALHSPRTAFLHPRFCFGPAAFFQQVAHSDGPRFLAAFQQRWDIYTLRLPLISFVYDEPLPPCAVEGDERVLRRFEKRFGLRLDTRQLSPVIRLGLTGTELSFPTKVPLPVKAQETARRALCARNASRPMCTTAYITLPVPTGNLPEEYQLWFQYLSRVKSIPLTCFAEGDKLRLLTATHPNVLEYKQRYALPVSAELRPEEVLNYLRLSRPFLLAETRSRYPSQTHYCWIDFGYLRYPVYEGAAVNWDVLCQDRICIAQVGERLDTSMIVIPASLLDNTCDEMLRLCEASLAERGVLPREEDAWAEMAQEHPDWFELLALPNSRELLTLTMLSRDEELHAFS